MTFNEYQKQAMKTAIMRGQDFWTTGVYRTLGLMGEAGEVAEKIKKLARDKQGQVSSADKAELTKELGDVLWYLQGIADFLGVTLEDVARQNLRKLSSRKRRGKIGGSGDNR